MTFLELCNAVRADANVQGTITTTVGQVNIFGNIVRWVQEAYSDVQSEHDNWNFLLEEGSATLLVSDRQIQLSGFDLIERIIPGSLYFEGYDRRPRFTDWVSFDQRWPILGDISTSRPSYYSPTPSAPEVIRFNSNADQNYTCRFSAVSRPDEMTLDSSVPIFSKKFHHMIKYRALMKYAAFYNAPAVAQGAEKDYIRMLARLEFEFLPKNTYYTVPLA